MPQRKFSDRLAPGCTFKVLLNDGWSRTFTVFRFDRTRGLRFYDAETERPGAQRSMTHDRLVYLRRNNRICLLVR